MSAVDPLAEHVVVEFEVTLRCLFVDQPQRDFGIARDDDARDVIAERILEALTEALPEALELAVAFPLRGGGRAARGRVAGSSLGIGPFDEPLPPGDPSPMAP